MEEKSGNTRKQISPSKHWVFTFNNYSEEDIEETIKGLQVHAHKYVFQEEEGEEGTPHLQGYVEWKKKLRPKKLLSPKIHWEKCRDKKASIKYCCKEESRIGKIYTNMNINQYREVKRISKLRPWQQEIWDMVSKEPDERSIYWYWEDKGNVGKTALAKKICLEKEAIYVSGKASDMKYGVVGYKEAKGCYPTIIIIDVPRSKHDYISYEGIESIKNGIFFSTKYESGMNIFNAPHVIIFANDEPDYGKLSEDRWVVKELT